MLPQSSGSHLLVALRPEAYASLVELFQPPLQALLQVKHQVLNVLTALAGGFKKAGTKVEKPCFAEASAAPVGAQQVDGH